MADRFGAARSTVAALALLGVAGCAGSATAPSGVPSPLATAAVAPSTPPTATATSRPTPTAPAGFRWNPAGSIPAEHDAQGFAGSPAGYLVLEGGSRVWFSRDGSTWTPSNLPFEGHPMASGDRSTVASARAVAAGPKGFIVVGEYEHEPCTPSTGAGGPPDCAQTPMAWLSANGLDWTSSIGSTLPLQGLASPDYRAFREVWAAGDGWDASVESEASVDERALELLHTPDGIHWTALAKPPKLDGAESLALRAGVGLGSGRRLVWQLWDRITESWIVTFATTLDGKAWSTLKVVDGRRIDVGGALAPDSAGGPWLVGIYADGPVILSSADLQNWHQERVLSPGTPTRGAPTSFARWADGYLAIVELTGDDGVLTHQTWTSGDGTTWSLVDSMTGTDSSPLLMATGPAGPIAVRAVDGRFEVSVAAQ